MFSEHALVHMVRQFGPWAVGGVVALEAVGVPAPAETLLIAAALEAGSQHGISIVELVIAAAVGSIIGDNLGYLIGAEVGRRVLERWGRHVGLNERRMKLGRYLFKRHGAKVVFLARFVAFLRTFTALLAGSCRMDWPRFLAANASGGIAWAILYGYGAYLLGEEAKKFASPLGLALGAIAIAGVVAAFLLLRRNLDRLQEEADRAFPDHAEKAATRATECGRNSQDKQP